MPGESRKIKTGCGNMYITITTKDGEPFEVFGVLGKSGACSKAQSEGLTRCITAGLRHGVPLEVYVRQLIGISCSNPGLELGEETKSCPDAIALVLREFLDKAKGKPKEKLGADVPES